VSEKTRIRLRIRDAQGFQHDIRHEATKAEGFAYYMLSQGGTADASAADVRNALLRAREAYVAACAAHLESVET
jgi:hypothetical protein